MFYWGRRQNAFTLAELLIALAILGVIATFTIPKVLSAQQNQQYVSVTKEAAATIAGAYQAYRRENTADATTGFSDMTPYLNYVRIDTSTVIDDHGSGTTINCSNAMPCYLLASGAMLMDFNLTFSGTSSSDRINLHVDPDGKVSQSSIVGFWLYYNGRLTSEADVQTGTDAPWFSW